MPTREDGIARQFLDTELISPSRNVHALTEILAIPSRPVMGNKKSGHDYAW